MRTILAVLGMLLLGACGPQRLSLDAGRLSASQRAAYAEQRRGIPEGCRAGVYPVGVRTAPKGHLLIDFAVEARTERDAHLIAEHLAEHLQSVHRFGPGPVAIALEDRRGLVLLKEARFTDGGVHPMGFFAEQVEAAILPPESVGDAMNVQPIAVRPSRRPEGTCRVSVVPRALKLMDACIDGTPREVEISPRSGTGEHGQDARGTRGKMPVPRGRGRVSTPRP